MKTMLAFLGIAAALLSAQSANAQSDDQYRECQIAVSRRMNASLSDVRTMSGSNGSNGNVIIRWQARVSRDQLNGYCEVTPNSRVVAVEMGNYDGPRSGGGGRGGRFGPSAGDAERACRTEAARRFNLQNMDIGTEFSDSMGDRGRVNWRTDSGRRGYCVLDRDLRIVEFREDNWDGGGRNNRSWDDNSGRNSNSRRNSSSDWNSNSNDGERFTAQISGGGGGEGKCTFEVEVDGVAEIEIRGDQGFLRTLSGSGATWRRLQCNRPMPDYPSNFRFKGIDGRGSQDLVREPTNNNGTAVIRLEDPRSGREGYTGDVIWR